MEAAEPYKEELVRRGVLVIPAPIFGEWHLEGPQLAVTQLTLRVFQTVVWACKSTCTCQLARPLHIIAVQLLHTLASTCLTRVWLRLCRPKQPASNFMGDNGPLFSYVEHTVNIRVCATLLVTEPASEPTGDPLPPPGPEELRWRAQPLQLDRWKEWFQKQVRACKGCLLALMYE